MKNFGLSILFLCFLFPSISAQNLVPNESFESTKAKLNRWMTNYTMFEGIMEDWVTPNQGTPDIFSNTNIAKMSPVRKGVDLSPHTARTGDMMVGFKTYGCETFTQHCKEYIQAKLKASIEEGKEYYVEFYVQPYAHSVFTNNIGLAFSDVEIQDESEYGLYYLTPMVLEENLIANGPNTWHKISDTITADADYEYFLIGNFLTDEDTKIKKDKAKIDYSYYLIDDILIQPIQRTFENNFSLDAVESGEPVVLINILFETNKSILQPSSSDEISRLASFLQENSELSIQVIGHTDNVGETDDNYKLSESRALTVLDELVKLGIKRDRLDYVGFGEDQPVAGNDTEEGRSVNRRVEFQIMQ